MTQSKKSTEETTRITVEAAVRADRETVWNAWTDPEDIRQWNAASDDWHTTTSTVDLRVGGRMSSRMEAKDGSAGFDFAATFTKVDPPRLLEYRLDDDRLVRVEFVERPDGVLVRETFEAESTHDPEFQRQGWQAILDNFARHVESKPEGSSGTRGSQGDHHEEE